MCETERECVRERQRECVRERQRQSERERVTGISRIEGKHT